MGREILITGEEILYRDVTIGEEKPDWKKGPSTNLTELQNLSAATRMQISGNQYASLQALQEFFAGAFAPINHTHAYTDLTNLPDLTQKADLENGKIKMSQIPDSLLGNVHFCGIWDAQNNYVYSDNQDYDGIQLGADYATYKGGYFIVTNAPTPIVFQGESFVTGDWLISAGAWRKVDNTDAVSSVAGKTGNIVLSLADIQETELYLRFTVAMKTQYDAAYAHSQSSHAPANAQANVIEKIKWNGVELTIGADKSVNIVDEEVREMLITYSSTNGVLSPTPYPGSPTSKTFTGYVLGPGVNDFSITIGANTYTKANITNVVLAANTVMTINSLTLSAGYTVGTVSLLFKS